MPLDFWKEGIQLRMEEWIAPLHRPRVNRGSTGSAGTVLVPPLVLQLGTTGQLVGKTGVHHYSLGTKHAT